MLSKQQLAILEARNRVLAIVDRDKGELTDRLKDASKEIEVLASVIVQWIDTMVGAYKAAGCEKVEWQDDIRTWFINHQFFVEESVGNDNAVWKCHLSHVGWGRHVILSFTLK